MPLSLIAAVGRYDLAIGHNGGLPWHSPEDLAWFRRHTLRRAVVMGRRTWESLPKRPLPGRQNIVLSTGHESSECGELRVRCGFDVLCRTAAHSQTWQVFVAGGADVYRQALPFATALYITWVPYTGPADRFFPAIDSAVWETFATCYPKARSRAGTAIWHEIFVRRPASSLVSGTGEPSPRAEGSRYLPRIPVRARAVGE